MSFALLNDAHSKRVWPEAPLSDGSGEAYACQRAAAAAHYAQRPPSSGRFCIRLERGHGESTDRYVEAAGGFPRPGGARVRSTAMRV